jgi:uncharacterized tellurite resistance protein B-like protein
VREDKGGKLLEKYDEVIERKLLKRMKKEKKGIMRTMRKNKQQRRRMEDEIIYRVGEDLKTRQEERGRRGDGEFSGVRSSIPC